MCLCVKCNSGQHVIGGRKRAFMGNYGQICIKPTRQQTRLACPIMKVKPYLNRVTLSVFSQVVILCKERKIGKLLATAIETTSETSVNFASKCFQRKLSPCKQFNKWHTKKISSWSTRSQDPAAYCSNKT